MRPSRKGVLATGLALLNLLTWVIVAMLVFKNRQADRYHYASEQENKYIALS